MDHLSYFIFNCFGVSLIFSLVLSLPLSYEPELPKSHTPHITIELRACVCVHKLQQEKTIYVDISLVILHFLAHRAGVMHISLR